MINAIANSTRRVLFGVLGVILAIVVFFSSFHLIEVLDASEVMVVQSLSGELHVYTDPGPKPQMFGKVTKYPRQAQYSFCSSEVQGQTVLCNDAQVPAKRLRFNDGGHANLSGAVNWEMPLDEKSIINIHKKFGSGAGVEQRAVGKMLDAAVYLAGPLMSSTESSGVRRAELVQYINDQAENGVYVTQARNEVTKDAAGNEVTTMITEIVMDKDGRPKRQQGSILADFNIRLLPLSISELKYDAVVEKQIAQRQEATTQVQIARANAARAEQDAITVEAQGKAKAAQAKWEQETIKAKVVTEAEQKLAVATLAAKEAEQFKKEQILRGEGEAARKRLVMQADGALELKLEAYKEVSRFYADAIKGYGGQWVPTTVIGAGGAGGNNGAQNLIDMLTVKTAKELSLDMSVSGNTKGR